MFKGCQLDPIVFWGHKPCLHWITISASNGKSSGFRILGLNLFELNLMADDLPLLIGLVNNGAMKSGSSWLKNVRRQINMADKESSDSGVTMRMELVSMERNDWNLL